MEQKKEIVNVVSTRKEGLLELLNLLEIKTDIDALVQFPRDGFQSLDNRSIMRRSRYIIRTTYTSVHELFCPSDIYFYRLHGPCDLKSQTQLDKLSDSMAIMFFIVIRMTRLTIEIFLSKSFKQLVLNTMMKAVMLKYRDGNN